MPRTDDAILRFERNLQASVDRFAESLRRHLGSVPLGRESARLALKPLDALLAEDARLRRKARRNAPCYDLNRHVAVRRLIAMGGRPPDPAA